MTREEAREAMCFHREVTFDGSDDGWQIRSVNALKETVMMTSHGKFKEIKYSKIKELD